MKKRIKTRMLLCMTIAFILMANMALFADSEVDGYISSNFSIEGNSVSYSGSVPKSLFVVGEPNVAGSAQQTGADNQVRISSSTGNVEAYIGYSNSNVENIKKKMSSTTNQNNVNSTLDALDSNLGLQADTATASESLSGLIPFLSWFAGVIIILITSLMLVFTSIDCCYIAFPVFRNKCDNAKDSGNKFMTKKDGNGESQLRWISDDAQYALETGTIESGKNKWWIYLKRRMWSYIALAIVLYMFTTGNITLLIRLFLKMISGLMQVLQSIA